MQILQFAKYYIFTLQSYEKELYMFSTVRSKRATSRLPYQCLTTMFIPMIISLQAVLLRAEVEA